MIIQSDDERELDELMCNAELKRRRDMNYIDDLKSKRGTGTAYEQLVRERKIVEMLEGENGKLKGRNNGTG